MRVDFACNDEHGEFMGRAERVQVGELSLECTLIGGGTLMKLYAKELNLLQVGRIIVKVHGYRYGVGNWCWDGYELAYQDVLRLIHYLEKQKYWTCNEGPSEQYEKFNAKQEFTLEDLKECAA